MCWKNRRRSSSQSGWFTVYSLNWWNVGEWKLEQYIHNRRRDGGGTTESLISFTNWIFFKGVGKFDGFKMYKCNPSSEPFKSLLRRSRFVVAAGTAVFKKSWNTLKITPSFLFFLTKSLKSPWNSTTNVFVIKSLRSSSSHSFFFRLVELVTENKIFQESVNLIQHALL